MTDKGETLSRKVASLPESPGVYLWKDVDGGVLYVGKAKRLRSRVRSYLSDDYNLSPKNRILVRRIADVDTILVAKESDALILENNLIKEHQPWFNVRLRDDKSYPRIAVTVGETFPRVLVVRKTDIKNARYFGPYTDVTVLRRTLRIIRRIFTVRSCHYDLPKESPERACLDFHIGRCLAPCVGQQSREEYGKMLDDVLMFLEGRTVEVRTRLRERMDEASKHLEYERAAEIRNSLQWLEQIEKPQSLELIGGGDADAIGYARDGDDAVATMLRVKAGKVVARDHRFLEGIAEVSDDEVLSAFLVRYILPMPGRESRIVLPFVPADIDMLETLEPDVEWLVPKRGSNRGLVDLADQNARHMMESFKLESFETEERVTDPVYALGRDLGLTVVPRNIVCIDISTSQGRDTVGSLVWFEGGRPKKAEYRKYKIKTEEAQQNDFAAVAEVVSRFLTRRLAEAKAMPDLMVIDGGKGQLNSAVEAARAVPPADMPIVSLAKREEEIFFPGRKDSLRLPARSPSRRLLQRMRDEAHRVAVTYNRKRRTQRTLTSELLAIAGIGPTKRRLLLEHFGSVAGVKLANVNEIAALKGFSERLAERLLEHLTGTED